MGYSHTYMLRWDGMGCAMRCDAAFSCIGIFIFIKNVDGDDDDALMISATYCELMHINLYWSLIGSSLLVLAR